VRFHVLVLVLEPMLVILDLLQASALDDVSRPRRRLFAGPFDSPGNGFPRVIDAICVISRDLQLGKSTARKAQSNSD